MKHFLSLLDFTAEEVRDLIERARALKVWNQQGRSVQPLAGKTVVLLFEKPSTRTRISFEVAIRQLGGSSFYIDASSSQIPRGESYEDTGRVLSCYVQGIVMRTFEQSRLLKLVAGSKVPVVNGLSDLLHPCQVLADLLTVMETKGNLNEIRAAWVGDGNNVANSWIEAALLLGFRLTLACPKGCDPSAAVLDKIGISGSHSIRVMRDPVEAVMEADVINTDTWVSMGEEKPEITQKKKLFAPYQVNAALLGHAKPDAIVLHCLPAHRGEEITDEVMDGPQSRIWEQAENRLHTQKALLEKLLS